MNSEDIVDWITTDSGIHIPIRKFQNKGQAVKQFFSENPKTSLDDYLGKGDRRFMEERAEGVRDYIDDRLQETIRKFEKKYEDRGYYASIEDSRQSEAKYINIFDDDNNRSRQIRIADHSHGAFNGYDSGDLKKDMRYSEYDNIDDLISDFEKDIDRVDDEDYWYDN